MIYDFSLRTVGLTVGLALIVSHGLALVAPARIMEWLRAFPRSRPAGIVLCTLAAVWAFWLAATMDLGEFSPNRTLICGVVIAGAVMVPLFADEFLSVRALGILALLAAEPLLGAAFLRPEQTRLFLVVLAYLWATAGLFMVGAPYLLRDLIGWATAKPWRYHAAAWSGIAYGALLIAISVFFFKA
jgi:hypothetical protein